MYAVFENHAYLYSAQTCALKRKEQNENLKSAICNSISDGTGLGLGHAISYTGMCQFFLRYAFIFHWQ